jgi:hypothetical protein
MLRTRNSWHRRPYCKWRTTQRFAPQRVLRSLSGGLGVAAIRRASPNLILIKFNAQLCFRPLLGRGEADDSHSIACPGRHRSILDADI